MQQPAGLKFGKFLPLCNFQLGQFICSIFCFLDLLLACSVSCGSYVNSRLATCRAVLHALTMLMYPEMQGFLLIMYMTIVMKCF